MSRIRGKDTAPEKAVRSLVWALGYRYRLHVKGLPGKPDLVFRSRKCIIFVHGCFWHGHRGCTKGRLPKSNKKYWHNKIVDNLARDKKIITELKATAWKVIVVWQCELKNPDNVSRRLARFLG